MSKRWWARQKTTGEPLPPSKPAALVQWFFGGGRDRPERPHRHKIIDEHGNEAEVFVPPGIITRWP